MASNYLATILALTKPDASAGLFTTVNGLTNAATQVGGVVTLTPATGATFQSTTAAATDLSVQCASNAMPINYRSIWTDFGVNGQTNSHGWNVNAEGEVPTEWGMAVALETPYAGLMEYWWSLQAPTASAFTTWRSMFSFVTQATAVAEVEWRYDKMRWFTNPNTNANGEPMFTIDSDAELVFTSEAALGVGGPPRADANGAMFKVAGSAGTSVEHVVISPTSMTETGTVVSLNIPTMADVTAYGAAGSISGTLNNVLRNTHATGGIRDTLWSVGGDAATRWLTSSGDFAAGVDSSDSGAWKLAASYQLETNTTLRIDKTTLATTLYGGLTITPGIANTTLLTSTGYSSTGSDSGYGINLQGTWNTTGDPIFLRANVANTASGASALFMSLTVDSLPILTLSPTGVLTSYGGLNFSGTTHAGVTLNSLTTTQRDALTPVAGMLIHNTTTGQAEYYTSAWGALGGATLGANTFTGQQILSAAGLASTPPLHMTGAIFTGGSATTTKPHFLIEPTGTTSTNWSTAGTLYGGNAPSGFTGNLLDLQINAVRRVNFPGGTNRLEVYDTDGITLRTYITNQGVYTKGLSVGAAGAPTYDITTFGSSVGIYAGGIRCSANAVIGWNSTNDNPHGTGFDTAFGRSSAGVAQVNNGTLGTFRDLRLRNLINTLTTPASAAATGVAGTITFDADFIYCCTATDTWKRVAIATW